MTGPVILGRAGRAPLPNATQPIIRFPHGAPFEFCILLLHLCTAFMNQLPTRPPALVSSILPTPSEVSFILHHLSVICPPSSVIC